jgi:hypothetical protein
MTLYKWPIRRSVLKSVEVESQIMAAPASTCPLYIVCAFLGCLANGNVAAKDVPHHQSSHMIVDPVLAEKKPLGHYRGFLRTSVDLSAKMPPVVDQGYFPSSLSLAMGYAVASYYKATGGAISPADSHNEASASYIYALSRRGQCIDDAKPTELLKVLQNGTLSLADYPFSESCGPEPSADQIAKAQDFKITDIAVIDPYQIDDIKAQLERGNPVITVFRDDDTFQAFWGEGIFDDPTPEPKTDNGRFQALIIVGYNEERQAFRVMNSWGTPWGDGGYAWISYPTYVKRTRSAFILRAAIDSQSQPDSTLKSPKVDHDSPSGPQAAAAPNSTPDRQLSHRDPVFSSLDNLSCGRIKRIVSKAHSTLTGFVSSQEDLAFVQDVAQHEPNTEIGDVTIAPWPLCEALDTLERPLAHAQPPSLWVVPGTTAIEGEKMRIDVRAPPVSSFIYISYVQADGTVLNLEQPNGVIPAQTPPNRILAFGDGRNGRDSFTVSAPFGHEMVVVLSSASPLFQQPLPATQSERDYLSRLRAALAFKSSGSQDREVSATVHSLETKPRLPGQ